MEWRNGQLYSALYDDVYFSTSAENPQQGLAETDYVFLQHNQLAERFSDSSLKTFAIAETGFGSGLNFLCASQLWLAHAPSTATLHFHSFEKHPLTLEDLSRIYPQWTTLKDIADELLAVYQVAASGIEHFNLCDGRIQLKLYIGDVVKTLPLLNDKIDAWFLDGFAPSKNPDMWQDGLYESMAALAHSATTFATFTSAGHVRRGLQAAGFHVQKSPGYGKKREMLHGHFGKLDATNAS